MAPSKATPSGATPSATWEDRKQAQRTPRTATANHEKRKKKEKMMAHKAALKRFARVG
jgi:hypothetical protein